MASLDVAIGPQGQVVEVNRIAVDPVNGWTQPGWTDPYAGYTDPHGLEEVRAAQVEAAAATVISSSEEQATGMTAYDMPTMYATVAGDTWTSPTPTQAVSEWMSSVINQPSGQNLLPAIPALPVVQPVTGIQLVDPPPGFTGIAVIPDGIFRGMETAMLVTQGSGRVVLGTSIRNRQRTGVRFGVLPQVVFENVLGRK